MKFKHIIPATAIFALASCSSIDCSLDSVVVWTLTFYDSETEEPVKLLCNLTIDAEGAGTLYNKGTGISSMKLPMSHTAATDTLYLRWSFPETSDQESSEGYAANDVLYIDHDNFGHFDAIDCPAAVFHNITNVRFAQRAASNFPLIIDSINIIRPQVDYNDVENIRIYLRNNTASRALITEPESVSGTLVVLGGENGDHQ